MMERGNSSERNVSCGIFSYFFVRIRHTVWKNEKFTLIPNIIREINVSTSLVKTLLSRNFCQKSVRVNFRNFHTVVHTYYVLYSTTGIMQLRLPINSNTVGVVIFGPTGNLILYLFMRIYK